jgi:hypothetical protein
LLATRLTKIDDTTRGAHPFLTAEDECYYFGEYFSHRGYDGGGTNQLIFNYKIKPSVAAARPDRKRYKELAVNTIANGLRRAITQQGIERRTWVPIPPSKAIAHAEYDDRLLRTLRQGFQGYNVDARLLLRQTASTTADHETGDRSTPDELYELLELDSAAYNAQPIRDEIVLFDDVLTTGKHFKCCRRRLRETLPDIRIIGVFVARRVLPDPVVEFEALD